MGLAISRKFVRANKYGQHVAIIGEVIVENPGKVFMETVTGGTRIC